MANKSRETANLVSSKTGVAVTISGDPLVLGVGNTEHVRVTGGGLVGIGTDNPVEELHLFINQNSGTVVRVENTNTGTGANASFRAFSDDANLNMTTFSSTRTATGYGITQPSFAELSLFTGNGFQIGTRVSSPLILGTNNTERFRITSSGNIGIGTTNPLGLVQVGSALTTMVYVDPVYGSVGIGTTSNFLSPDRKLMLLGANASPSLTVGEVFDIKGGNYNQVRINHNTSNDGLLIGLSDDTFNVNYHHSTSGNDQSAAIANVSNDALHLGTKNLSRMVIDHEGRLGIGTTSVLTSTWGYTAPGSSTTGTQVVTIFGKSPAVNIIHDGTSYTDTDLSAINFGRRGVTTNPYRAAIAYHQKLDWLKIYANNQVHIAGNPDITTAPGSNSISVTSSGIGIGTTVPEAKLHVSQGNIKVDSGFGIDFGTTGNGSGTTTSEIFDDYEEGTWTPVIRGSSTAGTYQANAAVGWYRKVGDVVHYGCRIDLASSVTGGGTGQLWITGIPFPVTASSGSYTNNAAASNGPSYMYGITLSGTWGNWFAVNGQTYLLFVSYDSTGSQFIQSPSIIGANDIVGAQGHYIAA